VDDGHATQFSYRAGDESAVAKIVISLKANQARLLIGSYRRNTRNSVTLLVNIGKKISCVRSPVTIVPVAIPNGFRAANLRLV